MKLSTAMKTAIRCTEPGWMMKPGPTRRALVSRGLVHNNVQSVPGPQRSRLTPEGERLRLELIAEENGA
jgi:hypothetical protein